MLLVALLAYWLVHVEVPPVTVPRVNVESSVNAVTTMTSPTAGVNDGVTSDVAFFAALLT